MGVAYYPVAEPGEIAEGDMKPVDLGGREILLTMSHGELFAFARQCPHEASNLDDSEVSGSQIRCEGHSYCFDLKTGQCIMPPGGPSLAVLPIEEHDGKLCVRLEW
jgi:nitrite reductase/ring-hydroxylating ferredoxin subunit